MPTGELKLKLRTRKRKGYNTAFRVLSWLVWLRVMHYRRAGRVMAWWLVIEVDTDAHPAP